MESFREIAETEAWKSRMAELEAAAFADAVTGIPNRRYMELQLERLVEEHNALVHPLTVCILDLDHFKRTNDNYGHPAGDAVLCTVSKTLLHCLRSTDLLGRWGGDEFVMLLPRTNRESARIILERSRALVENSTTLHQDARIQLTVSLGAAVITPGEDPVHVLARADAQLYEAKQRGKNCWQIQ